MTTTTPDMLLVLPDVSITAGPQWATLLNTAFARIDAHDHSLNNGIKITPSGLNISSDLTFAQNNATDLRSLRLYANNSFTPAAGDRTCLYALGGELYYIDSAGNNVQLTLNGTVDVANAITALSIKDSGLFIQYFGDVTRQFRFNASAIPTGTTRVLSVPDSGSNDTFVTQAAAQTLTNKTLTSPVLTTPTVNSYAMFSTAAAPSAPASGFADVYVSNVDGQLHLINSAGVDTAIGAGSSSGKNYLQSYYGFTLSPLTGAATSLTTSGNRTTNQTVFGVSTASAATLITYNTTTPLRSPGDLQITFPTVSTGAFVESPMFTLDSIDVNTPTQYVSFESSFLTSGAVAGDVTVQIVQYDASGNYVGVINPSITNIPTQYFKFKAAWSPSSTATAKYSVRFTVTTASARTLDIQDIVVGPQFVTQSNAVGAWQTYTPTFGAGWGTPTGVNAQYRRVGDSVQVKVNFTAGTTSASSSAIGLPTGLSIDTSKMGVNVTTASPSEVVGEVHGGAAAAAHYGAIVASTASSTTEVYIGQPYSATSHITPNTGVNSTFTSEFITAQFTLPISQWTTNVTLAGNPNIEYASNSSTTDANDSTSFVYGASGSRGVIAVTGLSTARLKRVRFQTPIQPTDRLVLEISVDRVSWKPWVGYDATLDLASETKQGTVTYGAGLKVSPVTSTDVDVTFGNYASPGATYASTGTDWVSTGIAYWRVAKYSAVGLAELAPATATSQGSISRETSWTPYTATITGFGTVSSQQVFYKVIGDSLFIRGFGQTGTPTAVPASVSLPSGFSISTTKLPTNTFGNNSPMVGMHALQNGSDSSGPMVTATATNASVVYWAGAINGVNALTAQNGSSIYIASRFFSFQFEVPLV